MAVPLRVLILEDRPSDAKLMAVELKRSGFDLTWNRADTEAEYISYLDNPPDIILVDSFMPGYDPIRAMDQLRGRGLDVPVIIVTGSMSDEEAVKYIKHGAADYLIKDRLARLGQAVTRVLENKRLVDEKRRAEEERNRFFTLSLDLFCVAGLDGYFKLLNPAWESVLGWSIAELLAKPYIEFVHPDDRLATTQEAEKLPTEVTATLFENRYRCRDGSYRWLSWKSIADPARSVVNATARDVTEQKRADEALRRSEALLRRAEEIAHVAGWTYDVRDELFVTSEEGSRICGCAPGPHRQQEAAGNVHPEDLTSIQTALHGALAGVTFEIEHRLVIGGKTKWVNVRGEPEKVDGEVVRIIGVTQDITARRQLEEQYRQAQKMDAFGQLAGGVAHDFNNLLTVINGYADMLLEELPQTDPRWESATEVRNAGERAANLTAQLLAFSRKSIIEPKVLNLNELVEQVGRMLRRLIGENIALDTELTPALGRIKADPGQLEQVIMNLAVNARDAMPKGGQITIRTKDAVIPSEESHRLSDCAPGRYVVLSVSDTGTGMTDDIRARIFEPFFTTKGVGKGTGLGLATVYGIVKQAGGYLDVTSVVGAGSTFTVIFPAVVAAPTQSEAGEPTPAARGVETILLVEDEHAVRKFAKRALENQGYKVLDAENAEEALRLVEGRPEPIHVLVTDIVMPGMGGGELAKTVRGQRPDIRVIFASGYTDDTIIRHGIVSTTDAFIQKPFTPASLARKVRDVMTAPAG